MKSSISGTLGKLAYVSDTLNKASDSLSEQILEVESALQRYRLGVSAWVTIDSCDVEGPVNTTLTRMWFLGYGKCHGKWGLLISDSLDDIPGENPSFLREEPRDTKLAAVSKLPDLLKELLKKATEVATEAAAKADVTQEIAANLKQWKSE